MCISLNRRIGWRLIVLGMTMSFVSMSMAADVILNEYNAVSSDRWLDCDGVDCCCVTPPCVPACAADAFFGRVVGNGGDWVELVVTGDHIDMRGWKLDWTEAGLTSGTLTLTSDTLWSDLRAGTIITFGEADALRGGLDTDVSYDPTDPVTGDWWIHINTLVGEIVCVGGTNAGEECVTSLDCIGGTCEDSEVPQTQYVTTTTSSGSGPGHFTVNNDDWQLIIRDAGDAIVFGPVGEGVGMASGVSSREVLKLEEDPSILINPLSGAYSDGVSSSFGSENRAGGGTFVQDFIVLRGGCAVDADCSDGDACTGVETCNTGTGQCQAGTPVVCAPQMCDPASGTCVDCLADADCDDADLCNGTDTCVAGACVASIPPDCDDLIACTVDSCDALLGCVNTPDCPYGEVCTPSGCALGAVRVFLNEYNAVQSDRWLDCDDPCVTDAADTFFGRIVGNGGNWFELVVAEDHLDMRGWQLDWREDNLPVEDAGTITLSTDPIWSDLRSGTIITVGEATTAEGGLDSDVGYDPLAGDWWIHVNSFDAQYVATTTNVVGDGPGNFSVGNDNWQLTIKDDGGAVVFGPTGEGIPASAPGIGTREVFALEDDPSVAVDAVTSNYVDSVNSSFGMPNSIAAGPASQDFAHLRDILPVQVQLVTLAAPSVSDLASVLPESGTVVRPGETFFLEVWAKTTDPNGLSQVSTDISFDPSLMSAVSVSHSALFSLFTAGSVDNGSGLIDDLSGSVSPTVPPCSGATGLTEWARVATVEFAAGSITGPATLQSSDTASGVFVMALCDSFDIPATIYGGAEVDVEWGVEVVLVDTPTAGDASAGLPPSSTQFALDDTFFAEIWARTDHPNGFSQVSADVAFDSSVVSAVSITHTDTFSLFANGTIDNSAGLLDDVSGSVPPISPPCSTTVGLSEWARVAIIEMHADVAGVFSAIPRDAASPIYVVSNCGKFEIANAIYRGASGEVAMCWVDDDCAYLDGDCRNGRCSAGICVPESVNEGGACDSGPCLINETCMAGQCTGGTAPDCSGSGDQCNTASCDTGGADGNCDTLTPVADTTPCDDGNPLTIDDKCTGGVCGGTGVECVSDAQCPDDGEFCNGTESCNLTTNTCESSGDPCLGGAECDDTCDDVNDTCHTPSGTACGDTTDDQCLNPDTCDGLGVCQPNDEPDITPCDDGLLLTIHDQCTGGVCGGTPVECVSDTQCPDDTLFCNGTESCNLATNACESSGEPCAGGAECADTCDEGADTCNSLAGTPCGSSADDQCLNPDMCDGLGSCQPNDEPDGATCDDGNACTDLDECLNGVCQAGEVIPGCIQCDADADCDYLDGECTEGRCDAGVCVADIVNEGGNCNTSPCLENEVCESGQCIGGTETDCAAAGDQCNDASCDPSGDEGNCALLNPLPDGTACDDGLYCKENESCQGGACTGGDDPCPGFCVEETDECLGACCLESGCLQNLTSGTCEDALGGLFAGSGTDCNDVPPPCGYGACCMSGACSEVYQFACDLGGGAFQGAGVMCDSNPCPGACCQSDGTCDITTEGSCTGYWSGVGTTCESVLCNGACCVMGECFGDQTDDECLDLGGQWAGPDTDCTDTGICENGACCVGAACVDNPESNCLSVGGSWLGLFTTCAADTCLSCDTGDADQDGDVDLEDFAAFQTCFGGGYTIACDCVDMDGNGVIDLDDYAEFRLRITDSD